VEKDADGNDVLLEFKSIVSLKIEGLCPQTPIWLKERLTDVIAMRRQQFYYQRAHKRRLASFPTAFQEAAPIEVLKTKEPPRPLIDAESFEPTKHDVINTKAQAPAPPRTVRSGSTTKTYDTAATELISEDDRQNTAISAKPAPSEKRIGENIFPDPPKEPHGKAFECNQCFHILPDKTRKPDLWRYKFIFPARLTL
jgi:hypothetical protein